MKRLATLSFAISLALVACSPDGSSDDGPEKLRDDIPDPPEGGLQIVTQPFAIPPGEEVFMCMRVPFDVEQDAFIQSSEIYQMDAGHHTLVFFSEGTPGANPEPHECEGVDMSNVRIITTGAANGAGLEMPPGVVLKMPKGVEVWVQSHYINATDQERTVQDVINLELITEAEVQQVAGTFSQVDLTFSLPPQQESTRVIECQIPYDMTVPWLLPHMHEWGKSFKIEILEGDDVIFTHEGTWFESARNDFPIEKLDDYLELTPAHTLRTTCTWMNTEDQPLLWPQEMCVTFFPFFPGDGSLVACDETGRVFEP